MIWIIRKYNHDKTYYALFLDTKNEHMLVGIFERLTLISDDILNNKDTKFEEVTHCTKSQFQ